MILSELLLAEVSTIFHGGTQIEILGLCFAVIAGEVADPYTTGATFLLMLVGYVLIFVEIVEDILLAALKTDEIDVAQHLRFNDFHAFGVQQDMTVLDLKQRNKLNEFCKIFIVWICLEH